MAILFPLIVVPSYQSSNGDETIFYATIAGVLSGAVAGDHVSPISDTTVLTALACDCKLLAHVSTQAPYSLVVIIISIIFGTVPIGNDTWPNIIGILLGAFVIVLVVFFVAKPIINENGNFDIFTELFIKMKGGHSELAQLQSDTRDAFANIDIVLEDETNDKKDEKLLEEGNSSSSEKNVEVAGQAPVDETERIIKEE
jgi:hypothetical protein